MLIESNTSSDYGKSKLNNGYKSAMKSKARGETRYLVPAETPRERMLRVINTVKKKR